MSSHDSYSRAVETKGFMKTHFWNGHKQVFAKLALSSAFFGALTGCNVINPPAPEPTPTPALKPTKPVFTPTDYATRWTETKRPGAFRVSAVINGDTLQIQSVSTLGPTPTPIPEGAAMPSGGIPTPGPGGIAPGQKVSFGVPETVRLAGIVAPSAGQPGYGGSVNTITNWTKSNTEYPYVEVEDDPQFKFDEDGYRNVQIFFKGRTGDTKGQEMLLNRMMIRSGWALVDKHTATRAPLDGWLNDQEYAKMARLGLWKSNDTLNWVYKALQVPRPRAVLPTPTQAGKPGTKTAARTTTSATTSTSRTTTSATAPGATTPNAASNSTSQLPPPATP